jgi:hypothetical protein
LRDRKPVAACAIAADRRCDPADRGALQMQLPSISQSAKIRAAKFRRRTCGRPYREESNDL